MSRMDAYPATKSLLWGVANNVTWFLSGAIWALAIKAVW